MKAKQHKLLKIFDSDNMSAVEHKNVQLYKQLITILMIDDKKTITDLATELMVSVPKTTTILNDLIEEGIIKDFGKISSSVGRKANIYGIHKESFYFIAVNIRLNKVEIALMNFNAEIIFSETNRSFKLLNNQESLDDLIKIVTKFINGLTIDSGDILGINFNISGRVNHEKGYAYSFYNFSEKPLSKIMEEIFEIPCEIYNDSKALIIGEYHHLKYKTDNTLMINLDYGLGMGIILNGRLYDGHSGFSGEIGHIPTFDNEIICQCGKKGCLETEVSGFALIRKIKEEIGKGKNSILKPKIHSDIKILDLIEAIDKNDQLTIELLHKMAERLGMSIAKLINIFNPEKIIIGGALSQAKDHMLYPIKSSVAKYSLSLINNDTQIEISKLGEKAAIIGGTILSRHKYFI